MDAAERGKATNWFARKAFRELDGRADLDVDQILTAVSDLDDWFSAAPSATELTNQAQIVAALPAVFNSGSTVTQKNLLISAVVLGRAGLL